MPYAVTVAGKPDVWYGDSSRAACEFVGSDVTYNIVIPIKDGDVACVPSAKFPGLDGVLAAYGSPLTPQSMPAVLVRDAHIFRHDIVIGFLSTPANGQDQTIELLGVITIGESHLKDLKATMLICVGLSFAKETERLFEL